MKVTDLTAQLAQPLVEAAGCTLWDVEYVREGGTWYLRVQAVDDDGFEHPFGPTQSVKLGCTPCRVLAGAGGVLLLLLAL